MADESASQPPRRALLLRNAKSKQGEASIEAALARLAERGVDVVEAPCASRDELRRQILAWAAGFDCVIVGGGDGTLNGAAPALLETGSALGVLPLGTANDLARTLSVPTDLVQAADVIADGRRRRIDLGMANERPFFNVASVGLSARLAATLDKDAKRRFGQLSYALAALKVLFGARAFRAVIAAEGEAVRVKTYQIAVGNGCYHGGGVAIAPDARIDDSRLLLYSLEPGSLWKVVLMAPLFRRGLHVDWREVRTAQGRAMEIRTPRPMPVNLDGDLATETPLVLTVRPRAIEVFAPPG